MQKAYRAELDRLLVEGIIAEVHEHTKWVNSIVIVPNLYGTTRLCLDSKDLNKAVKRNQWYSRTMDDILPELAYLRYYTINGATSGFCHVPLDLAVVYSLPSTCHGISSDGSYYHLASRYPAMCSRKSWMKL